MRVRRRRTRGMPIRTRIQSRNSIRSLSVLVLRVAGVWDRLGYLSRYKDAIESRGCGESDSLTPGCTGRVLAWPRSQPVESEVPAPADAPDTGRSFNGRTPRSGRGYRGSNPCLPANSHFTRQTTVKHTFASVSNALFDGPRKTSAQLRFESRRAFARLVKRCQLRLATWYSPDDSVIVIAVPRASLELRYTPRW